MTVLTGKYVDPVSGHKYDGTLYASEIIPFWRVWFESGQELGGVIATLVDAEDKIGTESEAIELAGKNGWIK